MDANTVAVIQQMQQQIVSLQQQLAHQPPLAPHSQAAPQRVDRPRLPPPAQYDGRSAAALDSWLRELQQQFEWYGTNDDVSQIRFGAALLKGAALDWWSSLSDAGASPDSTKPTTFANFALRLRGRFQPINSAQTARLQLDDLRQGPKQAVQDYISAFRTLIVHVPDMSEGDRVHRFLRGLRPNIATQLRVNGVSTLDASIAMAARVGSIVEQGATMSFGSSSSSSHAAASTASSSSNHDMDCSNIEGLDAETSSSEGSTPVTQAQLLAMFNSMRNERGSNRSTSKSSKSGGTDVASAIGKRFKMSSEQVREHFEKGQCFNCHESGHSSRSCSKPKKN
jgi:hypothetical protein